jgi:cytochrome c oxidase subunit II
MMNRFAGHANWECARQFFDRGSGEEMRNLKNCKGSTAVAFIFALILVLLTAVTVYIFVAKTWWYPSPITAIGHEIDAQFMRTLWITGIVFIAAQLGLAWAIFRYRDRGHRAAHFEGNTAMEVIWTLATVILFVGLGIYGESAWAQVHFTEAEPGAMRVEVTGQQFAWWFRYPGPNNKFGPIKPELISASSGNPLGLDRSDPDAQDNIVTPILGLPVNREVELILRSQDVTHAFFVRELRLKQDTVPGMLIHIHIMPTEIGQYDILCSQLCGLGHYRMHTYMKVMSEADFEAWLKEQAANQ